MCDDVGDAVESEQTSVGLSGHTFRIHIRSQRCQHLMFAVRKSPSRPEEERAVGEEAGTDYCYSVKCLQTEHIHKINTHKYIYPLCWLRIHIKTQFVKTKYFWCKTVFTSCTVTYHHKHIPVFRKWLSNTSQKLHLYEHFLLNSVCLRIK